MKKHRLKITDQDLNKLKACVFSDMPKEAGAFCLAGVAKRADGYDIIVRRVIEIPSNLVSDQHEWSLEVSSQAINGLIALCENNELTAVLCHSHPENISYSPSDDFGERRIFEILAQCLPQKMPMASLLFWPDGITSRIWLPNESKPEPISELVVIGRHIKRIQLSRPLTQENEPFLNIFDRQIRAFGKDGQKLISQAKIGLVGCGGMGSSCAEQLIRLGVRDVVLIDPDRLGPVKHNPHVWKFRLQ